MKKMKRIYSIITIIMSALALAGCAKELEENVQKPDESKTEDGTMVLGAVLPDSPDASDYDAAAQSADTKTTISDNGDKTYSVLWAHDDAISVNDKTSTDIQIGENPKSAQFTLPKVEVPYCAVYPAGAASGYTAATQASGTADQEGYVAAVPAQVTVTVPATQKYFANGIDPDAAIMYAYSNSATEPLQFKHAMAYLKLTVDGAAVKSVRVNGNNNETMSGEFVMSFGENISFSPKTQALNTSILYSCDDGAIPAGTPMLIAIPAAKYDCGLTLSIIDETGNYQVVHSLKLADMETPRVYKSPSITFTPVGKYVQGGIYTVEDWNEFVDSVNNGKGYDKWNVEVEGNDKGVHLMADIYSSTNLRKMNNKYTDNSGTSQILEWNGTFYGHGRTITHSAIEPIFINIGETGKILNLRVSGKRTFNGTEKTPTPGWTGSIALNNAGEIRDCENNVEIELSGANTNAAGICRTNTGTIVGCKNTGNITISNPTAAVNVAGITMTSSDAGKLVNCTNEGAITITDVNVNCIVAGVVQSVGGKSVSDLSNKAPISIEANLTAAREIYMGGIAAKEYSITNEDKTVTYYPVYFNKCSNSGALKITKSGAYHMKGGAIGGIIAAINSGVSGAGTDQGVKYTAFDNCNNSGSIAFYESERGGCPNPENHGAYAIGGILGRCVGLNAAGYYNVATGYYTVIRVTCENTGTIDVCTANGQAVGNNNSGARQTYVGGIAGFVSGGTATSYVRGKSLNTEMKIGSESGGVCAGGILGGGYKVNIDGGSNANVNFTASDNSFIAPEKVGYVGAVLGWAASTVNITKTAATASFDFTDSLKESNFASGFAGVKTGVTLTVAADCTYQGVKVETTDIYGGGTKKIN